MIIKSLKLRNIRSYLSEEIEFPEGSVLLEGDIGSGKSTMLLAIEFALFGIMRGEVSGEGLLRNGKNDGEVELSFSLGNREFTVCRTLKRDSKGAVSQDSGYVVSGGLRKYMTALELKSFVLKELGYPSELLMKGRSLIYRYTVYTPQESMKKILESSPDERLDTIRKIFRVDRYKRVKENSRIVARELKRRASELYGESKGIEEKEKELSGLNEELSEKEKEHRKLIEKEIPEAEKKLSEAGKMKAAARKEADALSESLKDLEVASKELEITKEGLKRDSDRMRIIEKSVSENEKSLSAEKAKRKEVKQASARELAEKVSALEKELREKELLSRETRTRVESASKSCENVVKLSECPTCLQTVSEEHKEKIRKETEEKKAKLEKILSMHESEAKNLRSELDKEKKSLEKAVSEEKLSDAAEQRITFLEKRLKEQEEESGELSSGIREKEKTLEALEKKAASLEKLSSGYGKKKAECEKAESEEREVFGELSDLKSEEARVRQAMAGAKELMKRVSEEIGKKSRAKKESEEAKNRCVWVSDHFIPLVDTIEQHVMTKIQQDFDSLFRDWFGVLIEEDMLSARLGEDFSPVITQDGYETAFENLSGGEKTSVSLAYRLALNRVVNDLNDSIKTKDLLILDEPTDGFSEEQLNKVRDVLDDLGLRQIIIVSHEPKIETFVENTIRIEKKEHVSRVVRQ